MYWDCNWLGSWIWWPSLSICCLWLLEILDMWTSPPPIFVDQSPGSLESLAIPNSLPPRTYTAPWDPWGDTNNKERHCPSVFLWLFPVTLSFSCLWLLKIMDHGCTHPPTTALLICCLGALWYHPYPLALSLMVSGSLSSWTSPPLATVIWCLWMPEILDDIA